MWQGNKVRVCLEKRGIMPFKMTWNHGTSSKTMLQIRFSGEVTWKVLPKRLTLTSREKVIALNKLVSKWNIYVDNFWRNTLWSHNLHIWHLFIFSYEISENYFPVLFRIIHTTLIICNFQRYTRFNTAFIFLNVKSPARFKGI